MNEIKLKPCPFCGSEPFVLERYTGYSEEYIVCIRCVDCDIEQESIEQWNTRYDERVANIIY